MFIWLIFDRKLVGEKGRYMLLRLIRYAQRSENMEGKVGEHGTLLCVDAKACHLREIRSSGEVEDVYVVKDVVSVEPAKDEEPGVGQERSMITTWRRRSAEPRARLVL